MFNWGDEKLFLYVTYYKSVNNFDVLLRRYYYYYYHYYNHTTIIVAILRR